MKLKRSRLFMTTQWREEERTCPQKNGRLEGERSTFWKRKGQSWSCFRSIKMTGREFTNNSIINDQLYVSVSGWKKCIKYERKRTGTEHDVCEYWYLCKSRSFALRLDGDGLSSSLKDLINVFLTELGSLVFFIHQGSIRSLLQQILHFQLWQLLHLQGCNVRTKKTWVTSHLDSAVQVQIRTLDYIKLNLYNNVQWYLLD